MIALPLCILGSVVTLMGWMAVIMFAIAPDPQAIPERVHLLLLVTICATFVFAALGIVIWLLAGRSNYWRNMLYRKIVDGAIKEVLPAERFDGGYYFYALAEGTNRAGQTITEKVDIHPDRWKSLQVGEPYPWTN